MTKIVSHNNHNIKVEFKGAEELNKEVNQYYTNYIQEDDRIFRLYDGEGEPTGSQDMIDKEISEWEKLLYNLENNTEEFILPYLDKIATKKNGRYRKGATHYIKTGHEAVLVGTEFTVAWETLILKMKAISEDEVKVWFVEEYIQ